MDARSHKGSTNSVQELRLVLFGHGWLEKNLTGNTILQQEMFDTRRDVKMCVRRQSLHPKGHRIIVVNTPDRWIQYNVQDPGSICDNVAECFALCQPGPHAFLLVVPLDLHKGKEWTVEGPLQLLGDKVWKNTMVIFTKPEKLKGTSMEVYTEKLTFLGPLLEKCGHRYHLLDTSFYGQQSQVEELLEKINAMIEDKEVMICSEVGTFLIDQKAVEEKAKLRQRNTQAARSVLRSIIGDRELASFHHLLIVGPKGTGKSSTGNTILCHDTFQTSHNTSQRSTGQTTIGLKNVTVVDTPGWHGRYYSQDTPLEVLQQILPRSNNTSTPNAVLLVFRCDETFTETDRLKAEEHMSLLGDWAWSKTVVLFTHKDKLGGTAIEEHIERWPALRRLVKRCGNRYHVFNNSDKNNSAGVRELLEKIEELEVLNDHQYLLQCLMQIQERYRNLEEDCNKFETELKKSKAENEKIRKTLEEKDCLSDNLMETILQKDDEVCAYKNKLEDASSQIDCALLRLESAEQVNKHIKECLKVKDDVIEGLLAEREKAQRSSEMERQRFHKLLRERKHQTEMEVMKLKEENKRLKTENEYSKMTLKSVVMEVQKYFEKKYNLQRKMTVDIKTLEMLFRLENEEEMAALDRHTCKQKQDALEPCKINKMWSGESLTWAWLMAGSAALGAVVGCSWAKGGIKLNMSAATGAAAGALLGFCWNQKMIRMERKHGTYSTESETDRCH